MDQFRIILTAVDIDHCPLFRSGQKMVLSLPGVNLHSSDQICIYALYSFFPFLVALSRHEDPESRLAGTAPNHLNCCQNNRFACCAEGNFATFRVGIDRKEEELQRPESATSKSEKEEKHRKRDLIPFLLRLPFFRALPELDMEQVIRYFRFQKIPGGSCIIRQGDPGRHFYVVLKGQVEVMQNAGTLNQRTLAILGQGECFGEMSLLSNSPCSATVASRDPIVALVLSKEDFNRLLTQNASLQLFFAKLFAKRLETTQQLRGAEKQEDLAGSLETFPLADLVQTVFGQHLTGILFLFSVEQSGQIFFNKGQLINALTGTTRGIKAFYKMLCWDEGRFLFRNIPKLDVKQEIRQNTMALILDGVRVMDEEKSRSMKHEGSK